MEMIRMFLMMVMVTFLQIMTKHTLLDRSHPVAQIRTRLIQSDRIKRCQHSDIRDDRDIVFRVAVTVRRDITDQRNMEARAILTYRIRILCHLVIEHRHRIIIVRSDRILRADSQATSATDTLVMIDMYLVVLHDRRSMCTDFLTGTASHTLRLINTWLTVTMLLHLSGTGSASHTDILDCATESCRLMSLEMSQ